MTAIRQELLPGCHGFQDAAAAFLSQRTVVDALQLGHITDKCCVAMHVQIIEHKHPAGIRVGLQGVVDVPGKIAFRSCLCDRQ